MAESQSTPSCPSCRAALHQAGFTERCNRCDGAWIHEDVLVGLVQEKASAIVELPWHPREPAAGAAPEAPRPCAVCQQPMQPVSLGEVALDRCTAHGVWFDARELASVLRHAREFKADPAQHEGDHRHGLLGRIARLFGG
ncbi:MAG TPA: zf-TFIIB domain-containing protein [Kofleriaceae bacterium]|nr:zf-TFIIB domain-containing protein [Kofleriaceae bacterium]